MVDKLFNIMIVEDNTVVAIELKESLEAENYRIVDIVSSGQAAINKTKELSPDLILMDIKLSDNISGIEATSIIKEFSEVPIIFTTAYSDTDTIKQVKNSGSEGYILKPYNYNELFTMIDLVLKKSVYQYEVKLREKKYHTLFDDSKDPIFIINEEGKFIDVNKSFLKLFGFDYDNLINSNLDMIFNEKKSTNVFLEELNENKSVEDKEIILIKNNKEIITTLISAKKLDESVFHYIGYQGIIHDISKQKESELEIQITLAKLKNAIDGIIKVVAATLEVRDPYTSGHQKRVADIAEIIATEMGLTKDTIEAIRISGEIHDIGKISVPAEILSKPGRINKPEFELIKLHPEIGYQILKDIEFPWDVANIIYQHHERIDGNGYPRQLSGDQIKLEAKILSVADVLEAMASHRPYRASLGFDKALEEVISKKGIMFDPEVVNAVERALKKGTLNETHFNL